jgi:hypothetical protein
MRAGWSACNAAHVERARVKPAPPGARRNATHGIDEDGTYGQIKQKLVQLYRTGLIPAAMSDDCPGPKSGVQGLGGHSK